jgi:F0F1-type ATP synthase epsilon subunit
MAKLKASRITIKKSTDNADYYIVKGGLSQHKPVLTMSKSEANRIAKARKDLIEKRKKAGHEVYYE